MVALLLAIVLLVQFNPDIASKVFAQTTDEVSGADAQGSAEQDMAQPVTVEVSRAELRDSDRARSLAGRVEPARTVDIAFQVSGQLSDLTVDAGTRVEKGDLIAALDPVDFELAVDRAQASFDLAKSEYDRALSLTEKGVATDARLETNRAQLAQAEVALREAERRLAQATITAPFDAIVTNETVSMGTFVSPGQALATLISAGEGEIRASLPAEDVSAVRAALRAAGGDRLSVRAVPNSSSLSSVTLEGYLAEFSPVIDQSSRTATVIAVFPGAFTPEHEGDVFTDDFMTLIIQGVSEAPIWRIPAGAVRQDSHVWVVDANEQTRRVAVDPIDRTDTAVLVHAPDLSGGEEVMTTVLAEEIEGMRVHVAETAS